MNTPRSVRHQVSAKDGMVCVTRARTSQGYNALISAASRNNCGNCVDALIAAKAALDIQDVSYARLFAPCYTDFVLARASS
jgi:gamma-glutamyltranspeptidase